MNNPTPLAVFDFDDTLVHGDSMWTFFAYVAGWPHVALAATQTMAVFVWHYFVKHDTRAPVDRGTFFKQQMLDRLIAGRTVSSFKEPTARLQRWLRWNEAMRTVLLEHHQKRHHIVIASGSLSLYLPDLVKNLPHHALLCTDIDTVGGVATSMMTLGNCVRKGKAERVAAYIAAHGPFGESWGYGNFPDDVPMMNLLKHRIIV